MKIHEVSEKYNITADTLRYYERIGLIPFVSRNKNGIRDYSEADCRWVQFVKCMRSAGLSVESLIEYVKLSQEGDSTRKARKEILLEERQKLVNRMTAMEDTLARLNWKIDNYYTLADHTENLSEKQ
ncbi:MAG: MerR family transcriptional regulator [Megasphaera sp.]|uniref:MerR family transcriptional regulator n=1 Tax=Megasphaera sueciensis TaxID=349094 RepID=UPI003D05E42F|nr:MerR family transcriptional regulator [Megasphaera sp.]MCI1823849.1 MerR family transcriptional regulator [Megasphaera sp.]